MARTDMTSTDSPTAPSTITPTDVDPTIRPLMIASREWFSDTIEQYEMSVGGVGVIDHITPKAVTFAWNNNGSLVSNHPHHANLDEAITDDHCRDTIVVEDGDVARETGKITTWKQESYNDLYIYERVPFQSAPITTADGLTEELTKIMKEPPDFEALYAETSALHESRNQQE